MARYIPLILIITLIVVSCFRQVCCARLGRKITNNKRRLNKRLTPPDADDAVSGAKAGLLSFLAVAAHTVQTETKFMDKAQPATAAPVAAPASISSNDDGWGAPARAAVAAAQPAAVERSSEKMIVGPAGHGGKKSKGSSKKKSGGKKSKGNGKKKSGGKKTIKAAADQ